MPKDYIQEIKEHIDSIKRLLYVVEDENSILKREIKYLHEEKSDLNDALNKLRNENIGLEQDAKNHLKMADEYYCESVRNRIEADLWKLILENGLENLLDKFYIDVPESDAWRYVHILVNEDYNGECPDLNYQDWFVEDRVIILWYKDNENFDAEAEFDKAVKRAKQGAITL